MIERKQCVIVGGGIAGLSAAYALKNAGISASVYEARDRAGGRIYSRRNLVGDGLVTELGGEFIDGSHTDILRYVKAFGLELIDTQTPAESQMKDACYFGGTLRSGDEQIRAAQALFLRIQKDRAYLSKSLNYSRHTQTDVSLDWTSLAEYLSSIRIDGWLSDLLGTFYTTEFGLDPDEQAALNMVGLLSTDTHAGQLKLLGDQESIERYKVKGGNDLIIQSLAQKVGDIHVGIYLEAIEQKAQGYELHFRQGNSSKVVIADHVVIAIPFSTLRRCRLGLPLTSVQLDTIHNLRYGTNAKVIVGVTERVWRKQGFSGAFTIEGAQTGWDSSRGQAGTNGSLTFYLGGRFGRDAGQDDTNEVADRLVKIASAVFSELPQKRNGKIHREHWPSDPWVQGSYACYRPGDYTRLLGAFARQRGHVYFAGEHLSSAFQGYMNGGAETGRKAAEKIIRRLR